MAGRWRMEDGRLDAWKVGAIRGCSILLALTLLAGCAFTPEQLHFSPLPSPTPADSIPPTPTPPQLREWPTPTPTPLPSQAERGRQFVAEREGIPAEQLHLHWESMILRPSTGEELWAGCLLDTISGHQYEVSVDASGRVAYVPDFSEQAVALLAEQEGIAAEQLIVANTASAIFPFSRQLVWCAKILDSKGKDIYGVNFDLDGNPVDVSAIEATEEAARQAQCPKLDASLCRTLLRKSSDDVQHVRVFLQEGADAGVVTQRIKEAGCEYEHEGQEVRARLSKKLIFELTTLDAVCQIISDWPSRTVPLDSNLVLAFEEAGGEVTLKMWTEKIYGCCNYQIDAQLSHVGPQQLEMVIRGLYQPEVCLEAMGPATREADLGRVDGVYELVFVYQDLQDRYRLTVSPASISLQLDEARFTWPKYETWLRLPPDAVWFVAQARTVDSEGTPVALERPTYQAQVDEFYAAVEGLDAELFVPPAGAYSNRQFVPPWPGWWHSKGDAVEIPIDDHSFYHFKWPDIRYYHYTGSAERLQELLQEYNSATVAIGSYTWEGEPLEPRDR